MSGPLLMGSKTPTTCATTPAVGSVAGSSVLGGDDYLEMAPR
jgi:hypothetical protein